ncbi:MAG: hypothetical protein ACR2G5_11495 [Pyrinomonadaceae bacterium]
MKKSLIMVVVSLFASCFSITLGQTTPEGVRTPPSVLLIVREDIKPGMMPVHNRHSAAYAGLFNKLQTRNHRIAMVPVAGSENEVLYVTAGESFADLEKITLETDKKLSTVSGSMSAELDHLDKEAPDLHAGMRDMLAVYRPELSYKPGADIAQMRYFAVTTVRVRPGQEDQYAENVRTLVNVARDKAKAEIHVAAYQIIAGSPATTYLFFRPMKSLAEYDLRVGPRVREAMSEDQRKKTDKLTSESVMFTETSVYAFNPRMSYLSKEFTAGDPSFWNPKSEAVARPKPKRRTPKPTPPPAAQ